MAKMKYDPTRKNGRSIIVKVSSSPEIKPPLREYSPTPNIWKITDEEKALIKKIVGNTDEKNKEMKAKNCRKKVSEKKSSKKVSEKKGSKKANQLKVISPLMKPRRIKPDKLIALRNALDEWERRKRNGYK